MRRAAFGRIALAAGIAASLTLDANAERVFSLRNAQMEPLQWSALDGWADDDHFLAFQTFLNSCKPFRFSTDAMRKSRTMYGALYPICLKAHVAGTLDKDEAREFFEANFNPVRVAPLGDPNGFLTGYYEPVIEGSRQKSDQFNVPVYRVPANLIVAGKKRLAGAFPSSGAKVGRLVSRRKTVPYHDRTAIEEGALNGRGLEICYLKDHVDHFFAQIQGSTRVKLGGGETLRLNYAAHNGYPYTPVGRFLIERGVMTKDEMSMERIRQYMAANPAEGQELRRKNRSFVFFRETGLGDHEEPLGAQGVQLTPGRSIAVDKNLHVYGTPFWIEADLPLDGDRSGNRFRRLMIAQDTGSAIVGPARADIYFGSGDAAGAIAGRIKNPGKFVMLLPKELTTAPAEKIPLPKPRPKEAMVAEVKPDVKPDETKPADVKPTDEKPAADIPLPKLAPKQRS